ENVPGLWVGFKAGITPRDDSGGGQVRYPVYAKAMLRAHHRDVSAAQIRSGNGADDDVVAIQKVGLHAGSLRPELHAMSAEQQRDTQLSEQASVFADLDVTRGHGEWPPQRRRLEQNERLNREWSG